MRPRFTGLWRSPDFLRLWAGQTVSLFGSQVTVLALPLTAVLLLRARPSMMGLLGAAAALPYLLFGLVAGVWVDRLSRRQILLATNVGRALLLGLVPASALLGRLSMEELYAVAFLVGLMTVFFDVAYQAYLPALVRRDQLVEGNSKLEVSFSIAQVAGPSLGGALVQLLTAPIAILVDSLSFLVSVASLLLIRSPEPPLSLREDRRSALTEIAEGLRFVFDSPILRSLVGATATFLVASSAFLAVYVLYLARDLGLAPVLLGAVFAVGAVGGLLGALAAGAVSRRLGLGPALVISILVSGGGALLIPLAGGPLAMKVGLVMAGQFLVWLGLQVYSVNALSLRQGLTPNRLQGRVNATARFVIWGAAPIGALAGGFLGEAIGLRGTLLVSAFGAALSFLWVLLSPAGRLRAQPSLPAEPEARSEAVQRPGPGPEQVSEPGLP